MLTKPGNSRSAWVRSFQFLDSIKGQYGHEAGFRFVYGLASRKAATGLKRVGTRKDTHKPEKAAKWGLKAPSIAALDREFSLYIRARDSFDRGIVFRCITCRVVKPYEQADCGHYLGRQYWATRWNPINCQAQCRSCNRFNEGLKGAFRQQLLEMYDRSNIDALEAGHKKGHKPRAYEAIEIMKQIKALQISVGLR